MRQCWRRGTGFFQASDVHHFFGRNSFFRPDRKCGLSHWYGSADFFVRCLGATRGGFSLARTRRTLLGKDRTVGLFWTHSAFDLVQHRRRRAKIGWGAAQAGLDAFRRVVSTFLVHFYAQSHGGACLVFGDVDLYSYRRCGGLPASLHPGDSSKTRGFQSDRPDPDHAGDLMSAPRSRMKGISAEIFSARRKSPCATAASRFSRSGCLSCPGYAVRRLQLTSRSRP